MCPSAVSVGSDAEEVQAEAEEVISWREGRTFGESFLQRRRTLTGPPENQCPAFYLLPAAPGKPFWCQQPAVISLM